MRTSRNIKKKIFLACIILSCVYVAFLSEPAKVSAWIGTGDPSSASRPSNQNNTGASCSSQESDYYRIDCAGISWIYYTYTGGNPDTQPAVTYPFAAGATYTDSTTGHSAQAFEIPADCARVGGFWHFGINAKGRDASNRFRALGQYNWIGATNPQHVAGDFRYAVGQGMWGHWGTSLWEIATKDPYDKHINTLPSTSIYHEIYSNGSVVYRAQKSGVVHYPDGSDGQVLLDYREAYQAETGNSGAGIASLAPEVWGFCYAPGMGEKVATYSATSTVKEANQTVKSDNYTINFTHTITRTGRAEDNGYEVKNPWQIKNGSSSGSVSNKSGAETSGEGAIMSTVGQSQTISYADKQGAKETGTILPGQTITRCQAIGYSSKISSKNGNTSATSAAACGTVTRNSATFTGSVTATVKKNSSKTNVTIPANKVINLTDSDDGYYEISFTHNVKRNSDGAGGNVKTQYSSSRRETSTGGVSAATWSPTDGSSSGDTNALAEGGNQNVWSPKVSGTLKYGESRTFCSSMSYRAKQSSSDNLTAATNSEYCITVVRPKAKCLINTSYEYGVKDGKNLGTVGVRNFNSGLEDFSWTTVNSNSADSALAYNNANIWAMPGDDIQFKYGACAGAFYAIEQSNISGKGTHYATAGWLAKNANGTNGSSTGTRYFGTTNDGYLFKNEANKYANYSNYRNPVNANNVSLAAISATTALPYATWTTGYNGASKPTSGFLSNPSEPVAEMYGNSNGVGIVKSPSSPSTSNYDGDVNNTYKICKTADGQGCVLGKQDVGGVIVQQLTWNYLNISNGSVAQGPSNYSATGMVRVPYNYYLQPYVTNNTSGVMYLGESGVMDPGVVIYPRENSYIHGGTTYATVTKETHINVRVYNQRTGRTLAGNSTIRRLNKDGKTLDSTSETELIDDSFLPNGISFNIADDGYNKVGDKICTELKVWPIDSHETGDRTAVKGGAKNSAAWDKQYALIEGYTTRADGSPKYSATATSCSTIAKRPTMSVESSNAYSATSFTTSLYAKNLNSKKYIFGSWSEYGVFGKVNTTDDGKTFVSGAAIGYAANSGSVTRNAVRGNSDTLQVATGNTSGKTCLFTTQTFINMVGDTCSTSDVNIGKDSMKDYRDNILRRFDNLKDERNRVKNTTGGKYNLDISSADVEGYRIDDGDTSSAIGIYSNGSAILSSVPAVASGTNHTIIYNVHGTLTIKGNINNESNVAKTDPSQITGVIIIADKVWIDASVEYINAVIITRETDNAEINTCKTDNGVTMTIGKNGTLNSSVCNKTLVFDAPVFTRKIILNRTAGASDGADSTPAGVKSITRAEIFNLNMANYLWSYEQMTHHGQAETTYIRELPTRY